jgi:hypothetical protein
LEPEGRTDGGKSKRVETLKGQQGEDVVLMVRAMLRYKLYLRGCNISNQFEPLIFHIL